MSRLTSRLEDLQAPKDSANLVDWFRSLSDEDKDAACEEIQNENIKSYTLFGIFREENLRCSKDTFMPFRKAVLAGKISRSDIDE